jgi:hypothetical protein
MNPYILAITELGSKEESFVLSPDMCGSQKNKYQNLRPI